MSSEPATAVAYGIDDRPPPVEATFLGLQHLVAMLLGNITPPLLIAGGLGLATGQTALVLQTALFMAARFLRDKGQDTLVDALQTLPANIRAFLAGKTEGRWFQEVARRMEDAGLEGRVKFLGHRDDVRSLLNGMDMVIAPSRREALGIALLEALGAGVPIVASRVGGIPEVVTHEHNGLLVEPDNQRAACLDFSDDAIYRFLEVLFTGQVRHQAHAVG